MGTQLHSLGSFAGLWDPPTHSGGAGPRRVAWGRAGHPLCCLMSPHHSLRGHPQPPQHRAGSSGGAERCLRLRLPQFNLLPNVCHHPQKLQPGAVPEPGGLGCREPVGRSGDPPPPQPGVTSRRRRGEGAPKHRPIRQLQGGKVRREIQDSLCVWTRPRETGAPRGK